MAGRPRKPLEEHEQDGTFREDRHGDRRNEVKFDGEPVKPRGMSKDASEHWDFIVPQLVSKGRAKLVNTPALLALCNCWANYCKAERSKPIPGQGRARQMEINGYLREWRDMARDFGMTPVSNTKIGGDVGDNKSNPFEQFLKNRMSNN